MMRFRVPIAVGSMVAMAIACGSGGGGQDDTSTGADAALTDATFTDTTLPGDATFADRTQTTDDGGAGGDASGDGEALRRAYVYAASDPSGLTNGNAIHGYAWDPATGDLTSLDLDAATGKNPIAIAAHPNGKYLYVVNSNYGSTISAFAVDPNTGGVTRLAASADAGSQDFLLGSSTAPVFAAVDPQGRCLYVADQNGTLIALNLDSATGALALGRSIPTAKSAQWIAVDTQARFLVVTGTGAGPSSELAVHRLDPTSGLPTAPDGGVGPGPTYAAPANSWTVSLDPTGSTAYVPNYSVQQVLAYRVDSASLALTPLPAADAGNQPYQAIVAPSGQFLYTASANSNVPALGAFAIDDAGALTEIPTDAAAYWSPGYPMSLDPTATHLYIGTGVATGAIHVVDVSGGRMSARRGGLVGVEDGGNAYLATRTLAWVRP